MTGRIRSGGIVQLLKGWQLSTVGHGFKTQVVDSFPQT
jgi:hypothetical protein